MTSNRKDVRMKRSTADRLLEGVKERISEVNNNDNFLYKVTYAVVFGSYVNAGRDMIGDLDIALRVEPKGEGDGFKKKCEQKERECKSSDWLMCMAWPREEVLRYIKNKSGYISIHNYDHDKEAVERGETAVLFSN